MARAVYSTQFLADYPWGSDVSFTVPAGYIAIVRSIDLFQGGGSGGHELQVYLGYSSAVVFNVPSSAAGASYHWEGRQVLEQGDELIATNPSAGPASVLASGYLLTTP